MNDKIVDFILAYYIRNGYYPTNDEILEFVGIITPYLAKDDTNV